MEVQLKLLNQFLEFPGIEFLEFLEFQELSSPGWSDQELLLGPGELLELQELREVLRALPRVLGCLNLLPAGLVQLKEAMNGAHRAFVTSVGIRGIINRYSVDSASHTIVIPETG